MTWYDEDDEQTDKHPNSDNTVRADATTDLNKERSDEKSQNIAVESDADDNLGRYTRDRAISFSESRKKVQKSREAARMRGEEPDNPLSYPDESEKNTGDGIDNINDSDNNEEELTDTGVSHEAIKDYFQTTGLDDATTLATGKTHTTEYEFVESSIDGKTVYAVIESSSKGVAYQSCLGNYGTDLSTPSISLNTDVLEDAIAGERKHRKRQTQYQTDPDIVNKLSDNQIKDIEYYFRKISTELVEQVLMTEKSEQEECDFSVSVVDDYVIVTGAEVTDSIRNVLSQRMSDKQLKVVLDAVTEALMETDDVLPKAVHKEISRQEKSFGRKCVIASRLELYNLGVS